MLVGDLAYTWLALRLARRTGRDDVRAMPFGIDTPTLFAMVFGVLGPAKLATGDAVLAWKIGVGATVAIGVVKLAHAGQPQRDLGRRPRASRPEQLAGGAPAGTGHAGGRMLRSNCEITRARPSRTGGGLR